MKLIKQDIVSMQAGSGRLADELAELQQQGKNYHNTELVFVHQVIPEGMGSYTAIFNIYAEEPAVKPSVVNNYQAK